jgi:hypothetical protein
MVTVERIANTVILTALLMLVCLAPAATAAGRVPERLDYELSWMGIPVGTASQEITERGTARRITSSARSNAWLSSFYPVEDTTESILEKSGTAYPGESRIFRMVFREGSRVRSREIIFSPEEKQAVFRDRISGERLTVPIAGQVFDIYAAFFSIRTRKLEPGRTLIVNVLDGRHQRSLEVRVLGRETVKTPAGTFSTIVIEPRVAPEGIFENKYGVTLWLSDDERRIPVKARTGVRVGSVTALLVGGAY